MQWIESDGPRRLPPAHKLAIARKAAAELPDSPALQADLGDALMALGQFAEAAQLYAGLGRARWAKLVNCHIALRQPDAALALCDRFAAPGKSGWHFLRGTALLQLHRLREGRAEMWRAIELGDPDFSALGALLSALGREGDGQALLETCDALDERYSGTAAVRGYRALAFSLLGREAEAREIVDLDRSVMRVRFEPPSAFGGIEAFNKGLAEEVLRDPPPVVNYEGTRINHSPGTRNAPHLTALRAAIRVAIADYAERRAEFGGPAALPPPPERATIGCGTVVLTGPGRNREHLHRGGYISTVYHVQVPDEIVQANDGRGALLLGPCGSYSNGHQGCWGTRAIPAVPGWLTLFPSHIFHDVAPTLVEAPRISVVSDLKPAWPAG
jgi:tetratricopeptide (TPR) repeat protein